MKKNLLIVTNSLTVGGVEKSLISLLNEIDINMYNIDLLVISGNGVLRNQIPKNINVIYGDKLLKIFSINKNEIMKNIIILIKKLKINTLINFIRILFYGILNKNVGKARQKFWDKCSYFIKMYEKKYDIGISYSGGLSCYYLVDKVNAKKKICWVHCDYRVTKRDFEIDRRYFEKIDKFVAVSEKCKKIFINIFNESINKTIVFNNIINKKLIYTLSEENYEDYTYDKNILKIISVGRLDYNKGFDIAVEVCKLLKDEGYNILWGIIGEGEEKENLKKLIKKLNLEKEIVLLGEKINPYPYIKKCDIFVHTSRFEGKSVVVDEAKIMNKPIVITNYETVRDQIVDGKNGVIAEINKYDIAGKIKKLINNKELIKKIESNLEKENNEYKVTIEKLYNIF